MLIEILIKNNLKKKKLKQEKYVLVNYKLNYTLIANILICIRLKL